VKRQAPTLAAACSPEVLPPLPVKWIQTGLAAWRPALRPSASDDAWGEALLNQRLQGPPVAEDRAPPPGKPRAGRTPGRADRRSHRRKTNRHPWSISALRIVLTDKTVYIANHVLELIGACFRPNLTNVRAVAPLGHAHPLGRHACCFFLRRPQNGLERGPRAAVARRRLPALPPTTACCLFPANDVHRHAPTNTFLDLSAPEPIPGRATTLEEPGRFDQHSMKAMGQGLGLIARPIAQLSPSSPAPAQRHLDRRIPPTAILRQGPVSEACFQCPAKNLGNPGSATCGPRPRTGGPTMPNPEKNHFRTRMDIISYAQGPESSCNVHPSGYYHMVEYGFAIPTSMVAGQRSAAKPASPK